MPFLFPQIIELHRGPHFRFVAGDLSDDVERWRLVRKYRSDQLAHMDMHTIVDDLYERATEFMHKSGLYMDEDFVGKSEDLYLWSFISESKRASVWGCPMRFTTGCCAGIRITETGKYLTLEFCGAHHPGCHDEMWPNASPGVTGFRPYLSSEVTSDDVESCLHDICSLRLCQIH